MIPDTVLRVDLPLWEVWALPSSVLAWCDVADTGGNSDGKETSGRVIVAIVCGCAAALIVLVVICAFIKVKGTIKLQRYFT